MRCPPTRTRSSRARHGLQAHFGGPSPLCQHPSSRARPCLRLPSVSTRSTARDGIPFARPCPRRAHGANRWCLNLHLRAILVRPQQDAPRGVWSTMSGASPEHGPGCRDIANRRSTRRLVVGTRASTNLWNNMNVPDGTRHLLTSSPSSATPPFPHRQFKSSNTKRGTTVRSRPICMQECR
jgi:hypothetical protein